MTDTVADLLAKAQDDLLRAQGLLDGQTHAFGGEEWSLVAGLIVDADAALTRALAIDPTIEFPLLGGVLADLREETSNFQNPFFLSSTRSARRCSPKLFVP